MGGSAKRKQKKIINLLNATINTELAAVREDFNNFILGTKENMQISKARRIKEQLVSGHLLLLKRASSMSNRVCEMQLRVALSHSVKKQLRDAFKQSREQREVMDIFIEKKRANCERGQETEDTFWLTLRMRIIINHTDTSFHNLENNCDIIFKDTPIHKRIRLLRALKQIQQQSMTYGKEFIQMPELAKKRLQKKENQYLSSKQK